MKVDMELRETDVELEKTKKELKEKDDELKRKQFDAYMGDDSAADESFYIVN